MLLCLYGSSVSVMSFLNRIMFGYSLLVLSFSLILVLLLVIFSSFLLDLEDFCFKYLLFSTMDFNKIGECVVNINEILCS